MTRVIVLLVVFLGFGVAAAWLNWDEWFSDGTPKKQVDRVSDTERPLPDVQQEKVPLRAIIGQPGSKSRRNMTAGLADALDTLVGVGGTDPKRLNQIRTTKKVDLAILNGLLPEDDMPIEVTEVEKLGTDGTVDAAVLETVARDRLVPLVAVEALAAAGRFPSRFVQALKSIAEAPALPFTEISRDDATGQAVIETVRLVADNRLVKGLEVVDAQGQTFRVDYDQKAHRWVVPSRQGAPTNEARMLTVARLLSGLGSAERRGRTTARHRDFDVEGDDGKRVRLLGDGDDVIVEFRVGKASGSSTFVRPVGGAEVFKHDGGNLAMVVQAAPTVWTDTAFFDVPWEEATEMVEQATRVVFEYDDVAMGIPNPAEPREHTGERLRYELVCDVKPVEVDPDAPAPGPTPAQTPEKPKTVRSWRFVEPESARETECSTVMVDAMVRQLLTGLRGQDIVDVDASKAEYGLEKPVVDVTVFFGDTSKQVRVGAEKAGNSDNPNAPKTRYAVGSASPFVYELAEYSAQQFMRRPEDLMDPAKKPGAVSPLQPGTRPDDIKPKILAPDEVNKEKGGGQ